MKKFIFHQKVYFGDTDAAGIVYHGRYVYWMEAARIEMLEELGHPYTTFIAQNIGFIPVNLTLEFKAPLRFGDHFHIESECIASQAASFTIENKFYKNTQLITIGKVQLACINDQTFKPIRLPQKLHEILIPKKR